VKNFDVSYDYRCPFAKNIHLHLVTALRAGADFRVNFVPWTLSQGYKDDGAPDVWNDPSRDSELLALAVSTSIRDQQPELFLVAHEALFRARHERAIRLVTMEEIEGVLTPLGVNTQKVRDDVATRRPHRVIGDSFAQFERYEAFGVPTFVVNGDATFVRYMTGPSDNPQDSIKMLDALVSMMELEPELNEFKHTRVAM
jgi:hypothetical protein